MNVYFSVLDSKFDSENMNPKLILKRQRELSLKLLDHSLNLEFDTSIKTLGEILYSPKGKPYFRDSDICFSYSHSYDRIRGIYGIACAVSRGEVGVDIECLRPVRQGVKEKVCSDRELLALKSENGENESGFSEFIRMWTVKEAYSKFTGNGFCEGFKTIDTTNSEIFPLSLCFKTQNFFIFCYGASLIAGGEIPRFVKVTLPS